LSRLALTAILSRKAADVWPLRFGQSSEKSDMSDAESSNTVLSEAETELVSTVLSYCTISKVGSIDGQDTFLIC
jgi:hypothetical protein